MSELIFCKKILSTSAKKENESVAEGYQNLQNEKYIFFCHQGLLKKLKF